MEQLSLFSSLTPSSDLERDELSPASTSPEVPNPEGATDASFATLSPRQDQIARLISLGYNATQVADKLGLNRATVYQITKSPLFKAVLRGFKKELDGCVVAAQQRLVDAAPKAADVLIDLMESEGEKMRLDASLNVLKGAGAVKSESGGTKVELNINETKLDLIFQTLKEIR